MLEQDSIEKDGCFYALHECSARDELLSSTEAKKEDRKKKKNYTSVRASRFKAKETNKQTAERMKKLASLEKERVH